MNNTFQFVYNDLHKMKPKDVELLAEYYDLDMTLPYSSKLILISILQSLNITDENMHLDFPTMNQFNTIEVNVDTKRCFEKRGYTDLQEYVIGEFGIILFGTKKGRREQQVVFKVMLLDKFEDPENSIYSIAQYEMIETSYRFWNTFGIGPKLLTSWLCTPRTTNVKNKIGVIVLERWNGDLAHVEQNTLQSIDKPVLNSLLKEVEIMHNEGYSHGHLLLENILYKKENNMISVLTLNDFDYTNKINQINVKQKEIVLADSNVQSFLLEHGIQPSSNISNILLDFAIIGYLYKLNNYSIPKIIREEIQKQKKSFQKTKYIPLEPKWKRKYKPCKKDCNIM